MSPAAPSLPKSSLANDEDELFPPLVADKKRKLTRKLSEPSHRLAKPVKPILKHSNTTGSASAQHQLQMARDKRGGKKPTVRRRSHSFGPYFSQDMNENDIRKGLGNVHSVSPSISHSPNTSSDKDEFWTPRTSMSSFGTLGTPSPKAGDKRSIIVSPNAEKYVNRGLPALPSPFAPSTTPSAPPVLQRAPSSLSPFSSTSHHNTPKGDYFSGLTRLNTDLDNTDTSLKRRRTLTPTSSYSPSLSPGGCRAVESRKAEIKGGKSTVPFPTRESFSFTVSKTPLNTPVATSAPFSFNGSEVSSAHRNYRPPSPPRRSSRTLERALTQNKLRRRISLFRSRSSKSSKSAAENEKDEKDSVAPPKKRKVSFRLPSGHDNNREEKPGFKRKLTPYYPESLTSTFDRVMTSIFSPFRTKSSEDIRVASNGEASTVVDDENAEIDYEDTIDLDLLCKKVLKNPEDLTEQEKKLLPKYNTILKMKVRKQRKSMEKLEKILADNAKELESKQNQEERERKSKEKSEAKARREVEWSFHSEL